MRTKQEVISFLESKVGTKVPCKGNPSLDGQCVTLIKAVMEFLGVPDPYKARGHAKTVISAYLNEGIADPGTGFLSVFSNKNMGGGYGHIWCNAGDGAGEYYESNGAKPLTVTKGKTYSYDNVCNFDKYIAENNDSNGSGSDNMTDCQKVFEHYKVKDADELIHMVDEQLGFLESERKKNNELVRENTALTTTVESQKEQIRVLNDELENCSEVEADYSIPSITSYGDNGLQIKKKISETETMTINYERK